MPPDVAYKEERYPKIEHVNRDIFDAHMERIDQRANFLERQINDRFDRMQNAVKEGNASVKEHMEAIVERKLAQHEAFMEKAINELNMNDAKIFGQMEGTNARLAALEGKIAQAITILGIVATVFGIIITALQFWK